MNVFMRVSMYVYMYICIMYVHLYAHKHPYLHSAGGGTRGNFATTYIVELLLVYYRTLSDLQMLSLMYA